MTRIINLLIVLLHPVIAALAVVEFCWDLWWRGDWPQ